MIFDVVELDGAGRIASACDLLNRVWADGPEVVPVDLAAAMVHAGGYCAVAQAGGEVVGASVGFRGVHGSAPVLHSHVTAATAPGAGWALKQHQRAWAAARGLAAITWTFDPLVRRNAYFNLGKLGCGVSEYLPDFYGTMTDAINAGDESDRLLAVWAVAQPLEPHSPIGTAHIAIRTSTAGPDVAGLVHGVPNLVEVPADIEAMRSAKDPAVPLWRRAVRDVVGGALADGWRVSGFHDRRAYVLEDS